MILSNITTSSLNVYRSLKVTNTKIDLRNCIVIPLVSLVVAITIMSFTVGKYIASTLTYVIVGGSIIVVIYFVLLFMFKAVSIKEFVKK